MSHLAALELWPKSVGASMLQVKVRGEEAMSGIHVY
jgi:hypothetical protein